MNPVTRRIVIQKLEAAKHHIDQALVLVKADTSGQQVGAIVEKIHDAADFLTGTTESAVYLLRFCEITRNFKRAAAK